MLNTSRQFPQDKGGKDNGSTAEGGVGEKKKEDNEEITRVLSTFNPNAPYNTMRYNHKTKDFRNDSTYG